MAYKKKPQNKSEKKPVENKAPKAVVIDWSSMKAPVSIIAIKTKHMNAGQEYKVTVEMAKILVENGAAKLK